MQAFGGTSWRGPNGVRPLTLLLVPVARFHWCVSGFPRAPFCHFSILSAERLTAGVRRLTHETTTADSAAARSAGWTGCLR